MTWGNHGSPTGPLLKPVAGRGLRDGESAVSPSPQSEVLRRARFRDDVTTSASRGRTAQGFGQLWAPASRLPLAGAVLPGVGSQRHAMNAPPAPAAAVIAQSAP